MLTSALAINRLTQYTVTSLNKCVFQKIKGQRKILDVPGIDNWLLLILLSFQLSFVYL